MERFIRKLFGLTFSALLAVVLLVGCISNNLGDEKSMNLKIDGIEQITVSTQTTGQKQDVIIEKEKFEDLISKLNSYSLKEITDEKESRKNFYSIYYDSNYRTGNRYGCKCSRNRFNPRQRCSC